MLLVDIRYCSLKDLNDIYSIEMAAYEYPWPYEIFEADLKRKIGKIFYIGAWWETSCVVLVPVVEKESLKS